MEEPTPVRKSFVATGALVAVVVALWLGLWGQLLFAVPAAKKRFDEYGLMLPAMTRQVIRLSDAASHFGVLSAVAALGGAVVWGGLIAWARHGRRAGAAAALAVGLVAVLLLGNALIAGSLALPEAKLQEGLRK